ncbi:50S ribosomal protein L24 [Candidatus Parcubacteria bacterium]|nr:50S ribosomal protein L24 [Patescibacteria group bacterium]MBU4477174.1 50S ribosomal protein L24 [Patescibacteria group bacterium]MCG2698897.1 50S ribosomal protein L24 [Candidatus Parcubacteria bacterium]
MVIKKGDTVKIISGKDKGKIAKVILVLPKDDKIVVEGVNMRKKHTKPRKQGQKGQVVQISMPIHASNAMVVCSGCGKTTRISSKTIGTKKVRVCKKCGAEL